MTYYDKYHCINCPVDRFCGTVVASTKLCRSYKEPDEEKCHVLSLSKAATAEEEHIEEQITMWDNIKE